MNEMYIYAIAILLPVTALMVVLQVDPYRALVIRGILGAIAALIYAVLGAADVALTEAFVGTLLAIALYIIAIRSSMVMRLGVLSVEAIALETELLDRLQQILSKHYLRVEVVPYLDKASLSQALLDREIHATYTYLSPQKANIAIRLSHLSKIMESELTLPTVNLTYIDIPNPQLQKS